MNDQSDRQSDVPLEEHKCDFSPDYEIMGFSSLCADRRFHRCLQKRFQNAAGLGSSEKILDTLGCWRNTKDGPPDRRTELMLYHKGE